jgi:heat shock protein HtpX
MNSAYTYQMHNVRRTWILIFLFTALTSAVFYVFGLYFGNGLFGLIGFGISLIQAAFAYYAGDKIALAAAHAVKVTEEEAPQIHVLIENLSRTAGIPKPEVYISPDPAANAFATGRNPENGKICLNQGILDLLNKQELEGVIAHELSHIKNRDILIMTMTMVMSSTIGFLADISFRMRFFNFADDDSDSMSPLIIGVYIATILLSPFLSMMIQFSISRKREFLADATGAVMTRYPEGLKSALLKLYNSPTPTNHYSSSMNHFYIAPVKQSFGEKINSLFSTHPPLQERIDNLNKMAGYKEDPVIKNLSN